MTTSVSSLDRDEPLLRVEELRTHFFDQQIPVPAVERISFEIKPGESLGLVGESGCGKTVTSLSIMRLVPHPGRIVGGKIRFRGEDLLALPESRMRKYRGGQIAMIFQEPMTSLNPVFRVGNQISEAIRVHHHKGRKDALAEAVEWMRRVAIPEPERLSRVYPHQLSGGMLQRIMIAMALSCRPQLLIADEPTTALDVTIQAQILDLLRRLREEYRLAILLISHNLGVIAEFVQRVLVMYAGRIVEEAEVGDLFRDPKHPYTVGLLKSVPRLHGQNGGVRHRRLPTIPGTVPNLRDLPSGCAFAPRCPDVMEECRRRTPPSFVLDGERKVSCFKYGD